VKEKARQAVKEMEAKRQAKPPKKKK